MFKKKVFILWKEKMFYYIQLMIFNFLRQPKMLSFWLSNLFGRVAIVKEEQDENTLSPIVVTLFGMVMEVNEEQPENALLPIVVTLSGIVIESKCEHP